MSFAAALWLLLLHAVSGIGIVPVAGSVHAHRVYAQSAPAHGANALGANALGANANADRLTATPQHFPAEGVRASYSAPLSAIARPSWRSPSHGPAPLDDHDGAIQYAQVCASTSANHVVDVTTPHASNASVRFPYYPTAPPITA